VSRVVVGLCVVATAAAIAVVGVLPAVEEAGTPAASQAPSAARVAWVELAEEAGPGPTSGWVATAHRAGAEIEELEAAALGALGLHRYSALVLRDREEFSTPDLESLTRFLGRGGGVVLRARVSAGDGTPAERPKKMLWHLVASGRETFGPREAGPVRLHRGRYGPGPVVWVPHEPSERQLENALRWALRQPSVEIEGTPSAPHGIEVAMQSIGPGRIEVELRNRGDRTVHQAGARIYLPVGAGRPSASSTGWLVPTPVVRVAPDRSWLALLVRELDPGESARYAVRYGLPLVVGTRSESGSVAGSEQARPRQM
jgi:hypothetical protein